MTGTEEMTTTQPELDFDGKTFNKDHDGKRLTNQFRLVFDLMKDGAWRTLSQISERTGFPEASISARIRDFRKPKFGAHLVNSKRKIMEGSIFCGWEYQLIERGF